MPANDILDRARQRKTEAEHRLQRLQEELAIVQEDVAEWESFIARAESLVPEGIARKPEPITGVQHGESTNGTGAIKVKRDSLAGWSVQLIRDIHPMTLKDLVRELRAVGKGSDAKEFSTVLNSALWRRKDLFEKKNKAYYLRTNEIEFVD